MKMLGELDRGGNIDNFAITVERSSVCAESFMNLRKKKLQHLGYKLLISFEWEPGPDYGGISREGFQLLSADISNHCFGLFEYLSTFLHRSTPTQASVTGVIFFDLPSSDEWQPWPWSITNSSTTSSFDHSNPWYWARLTPWKTLNQYRSAEDLVPSVS